MDVICVAAVADELGDLPGRPVGIGPVRAGIGAARALATSPSALILVGSAGAYPGGPGIGAVVVARRVGLGRGIAELGAGYVPVPVEALRTDDSLRFLAGVPEADVLTVAAISTRDDLVRARAATWQVEHMEAWSVLEAARQAGVPAIVILGIANEVGPDAHAQWLTHRARAEEAARGVARRVLGKIADTRGACS